MRYIVVGAGTAGCVVAARLSEDPANEVILLESGPDRHAGNRPAGITSVNWIRALGEKSAFNEKITAARLPGSDRKQYMIGHGIGGSGAVNAMICLPGLPEDYDRWAELFGCSGWAWADVEPWFACLQEGVLQTDARFYTPIDHALIDAGAEIGLSTGVDTYTPHDGVGALYLCADATTRRSTAEMWLDPARKAGRVSVRADAGVDRLAWEGDTCVGVQLRSGEQIAADHVVLCAGAFESPALLLRSGVENPAIGRNLRDHPAASLRLVLNQELRKTDAKHACINVVLRTSSSVSNGDVHLLPLHGSLDDGRSDAVVMAALMTVRSTGRVHLDPNDASGPPVIDMGMLTDPSDRKAMHEAILTMIDVLQTKAFTSIVEDVIVDELGTSLESLREPAVIDRWLRTTMGDYFHACGTCRMGRPGDPDSVVDLDGRLIGRQGVHVIDASVMPDVPAANTHWPTVMIAERLTAGLMGRSLSDIEVVSLRNG
jgi:choline dehydrogenase-like flavoprotein